MTMMASEKIKSIILNVHSFTRIFDQKLAGVDFWVSVRFPLPFVSDVEPILDLNIVIVGIGGRVDIARDDRSESCAYTRTSKHANNPRTLVTQ